MSKLNVLRRISFLRFFGFGLPIALFEAGTVLAFPFPYGMRDLTALFFAFIAWHPMVGGLKKNERLALLVGAIIPAIPPTAVLGAYILTNPLLTIISKSKPHSN